MVLPYRVHAHIPVPLAQCLGWTYPSSGTGHSLPRSWFMCASVCILFTRFAAVVFGVGEIVVIYQKITAQIFNISQSICATTNQQITIFLVAEKQLSLNYFLRAYENGPIKILSQGSQNTTSENISDLFMSQKRFLCCVLSPALC